MATAKEVSAVGERALEALTSLCKYAEEADPVQEDAPVHWFLLMSLWNAVDNYGKLVSQLRPKESDR
jgi:hypothetical protein